MNTHTKALFGGALLAAGMAAQTASADLITGLTFVNLGSYGVDGSSLHSGLVVGNFAYFTSEPDTSASATFDGLSLVLNAQSDAYSSSFAYTGSTLTVDTTTSASLAWDFSGNFTGLLQTAYLRNVTDNIIIAYETTGSGKFDFTMEVGIEYKFRGLANASQDGEGKSFVSLTIPAPGALALLGVAGMATGRRRRRE